jgi:hypothetical protein
MKPPATQLCDFQLVRREGKRFVLRCRHCRRVVRSPVETGVRAMCGAVALQPRPGHELFHLFRELRIKPKKGCECAALRAEMNRLGVAGCREQREELLARLRDNAALYGLGEWAAAGWQAIKQDKPITLGGLLDLAIERAENGAYE